MRKNHGHPISPSAARRHKSSLAPTARRGRRLYPFTLLAAVLASFTLVVQNRRTSQWFLASTQGFVASTTTAATTRETTASSSKVVPTTSGANNNNEEENQHYSTTARRDMNSAAMPTLEQPSSFIVTSNSSQDDEEQWETELTPQIVWLASYPNSGTSYTMTMVERATNLSTASNYGAEVTVPGEDSIPIYPHHPQGPYWEGLSGQLGTVRPLPDQYVLVKTHCGARCIKCSADEYVMDVHQFRHDCQRTTARQSSPRTVVEHRLPANAIRGVVHLIRNPWHNTVARFHLERRNMVAKEPGLETDYPVNATGFAEWCRHIDTTYGTNDETVLDATTLQMVAQGIPCYAEFYKWTQWHNRVIEMMPYLGNNNARLLTIHYEDYANQLDATADKIFDFLQQRPVNELRPFRHLPLYEKDHFSAAHMRAITQLVRHVATDETWQQIQHYFRDYYYADDDLPMREQTSAY